MNHHGSLHRIGSYAAYQNNFPRSSVRPGDLITVEGREGITVKKDYHTNEWLVKFPEGGDYIHENRITPL